MAHHSVPITKPAPEERPLCPCCRKPLRPHYHTQDDRGMPAWGGNATQRVFAGWMGYDAFCTQRCAVHYANVVYKQKGLVLVPNGGPPADDSSNAGGP